MDPNTARHVLRLDPLAPLTAEAVERAYTREAWERHPSRYPDVAGRVSATAWGATLAEARVTLLQSKVVTDATTPVGPVPPSSLAFGAFPPPEPMTSTVATPVPTPSVPASARDVVVLPRRRRRAGIVIVIVAASLGVLALFVAAGIGATKLAERLEGMASVFDESVQTYAPAGVESYSADEMYFTFPAAMEVYADGRYTKSCPLEFDYGCWETALITEASCAALEIDLHYANDANAWTGEYTETMPKVDVIGGAITPVVFGNDEYDYGWIHDIRCVDSAAPTTSVATETPLRRGEAAQFAFEQTGFWVLASLEVYADGRPDECPAGFERGCWAAAVIPQSHCDQLVVHYSFSNGTEWLETRSTTRLDVAADEPVEVVFGDDRYEFGWVSHAVCVA